MNNPFFAKLGTLKAGLSEESFDFPAMHWSQLIVQHCVHFWGSWGRVFAFSDVLFAANKRPLAKVINPEGDLFLKFKI